MHNTYNNKSNSLFYTFIFTLLLAYITPVFAAEQAINGLWQSTDDKTGKPRSHIRINDNNGEFSAVVEKGLLDTDTGDAVCDQCKDERKDKPIIGMIIMEGMQKRGHVYEGGRILDPENGKIYRCKMKLDSTGNKLEVRGFIGISLFGRSQMWTRVE
jgi:uncharacterized protein (DUF2147 family)